MIPPTIETKTPSEKTRHGMQTDVTATSVVTPNIPSTSREFIYDNPKRGPIPKIEDNIDDNDYETKWTIGPLITKKVEVT